MQGRTVGSSRTALATGPVRGPLRGRSTANATFPASDALTLGGRVGREHGSRTALIRSVLSVTLLAGGLSVALLNGVGPNGSGLGGVVQSAQAMTTVAMPRPRVQVGPPAILGAPASVLTASAAFAPIHDLDTELGSNAVDRVSYDFLITESAVGDPNDVLEFGPMKIRRHLVQKIVRAAQAVQTDPVLLMAVADKESSFKTEVQAQTSSATGLFQFIERTWLGVVRDFGPKHGLTQDAALVVTGDNGRPAVADPAERTRILELRRDPYLSALMAGEMLKRDAARIALRIGRDLSLGEVYLAHFLGPDDAEEFLATVADKPKAAAAQMLPGPARANKTIFFAAQRGRRKATSLSVAQVHEKFEAMMSARGARYRDVRSVAGIMAYADASAE
ncbi:MAG: transglycosylase SLT domain-containing protein [Methylobacterium sp.]|uniref:transglycosylase SLT domain-containing protein n=1 Tax=unclassified Methylobacterium TaxID=2615210 RepID=UPI0006F2208B|nr:MULTISPECIES: transglycosylase SLT domain-containing protein [unclassified Methylobacterium]KQP07698.1 transglycosylase SLT domain protein [Methylobacterium sp. Leaf99]MDO9429319.1 transglycosylase SLT domain-containing protein [Methylobacterium sp.]TXM76628.1 lytic transglycosylase domain-containing protein [Methylobacterium sp. WL69]